MVCRLKRNDLCAQNPERMPPVDRHETKADRTRPVLREIEDPVVEEPAVDIHQKPDRSDAAGIGQTLLVACAAAAAPPPSPPPRKQVHARGTRTVIR